LGLAYHDGKGLEKDLAQALYDWRLAAEPGLSQAQVLLGTAYHNGPGLEKDLKQAVRYYNLAIDGGNQEAREKLGEFGGQKSQLKAQRPPVGKK
jgi:TPR repeat protein